MPAFVHESVCREVGEVEKGSGDGDVDGAGLLHRVGEVQGDLGLESSLLFAKRKVMGVSIQSVDKIVESGAFGAGGRVHAWEGDDDGASRFVAGAERDFFPGGCHGDGVS